MVISITVNKELINVHTEWIVSRSRPTHMNCLDFEWALRFGDYMYLFNVYVTA